MGNDLFSFGDHIENLGLSSNTNAVDEDLATLTSLIDEISKYDIIDFIEGLSALNLVPENQNKSILFDVLIAAILSRPRENYLSTNKMSAGKFKKIVMSLLDLNLALNIDPIENCFIERVQYFGNYHIFPGINYAPGFTIQNFINVLFRNDNDFDSDYIVEMNKIVNFILFVSNSVVSACGLSLSKLEHKETKAIIIPDGAHFNKLKRIVHFSKDVLPVMSNSRQTSFFSKFGCNILEREINDNTYEFYKSPLLDIDDNSFILLNPSILVSFAIHQILMMAQIYRIEETLINKYNDSIWNNCRKSLVNLGHKKLLESQFEMVLENNPYYKEIVLSGSNDKIFFIHFICDDGEDYTDSSFMMPYPNEKHSRLLAERNAYLSSKFSRICPDSIYELVIINSFGRTMAAESIGISPHFVLSLQPDELRYISINEKKQDEFLIRYIDSKDKINSFGFEIFSELNSIEIYTSNDYSFYVSDDHDMRYTNLMIAPGDSIDYVIKAIKKENRHLVDSYLTGYLAEIISNDDVRNIYIEPINKEIVAALFVELEYIGVWVCSDKIENANYLNVYFSIVDAISYWISEYGWFLNKLKFDTDLIIITVKLTGDIERYSIPNENKMSWVEKTNIYVDHASITLEWTPEAYVILANPKSNSEPEMVDYIIKNIAGMATNSFEYPPIFEELVMLPLKRKFYGLEYTSNPCLKPVLDRNICRIRAIDENNLLDEIGRKLLETGKWTYGLIDSDERSDIAKYVVDYLYQMLKAEIELISPQYVFELVCNDLEVLMFNLILSQKRFAYDTACYPERTEKFLKENNEINKSLKAIKFFAEYIAACPPTGTKILGKMDYEKMIAVCSLIIDWAYKNDTFVYGIVKTPIEILPSGRIGLKHLEYDRLYEINLAARERQLIRNSNPDVDGFFPKGIIPELQAKVNEAFEEEYEYSFEQFTNIIMALIELGDLQKSEVKKANFISIEKQLKKTDTKFTRELITKVLDNISLREREDYLHPDPPFSSLDVFPWRFNRELSYTRRPIILYKEQYIWGNRNLYNMWRFTIDLMIDGKYKAQKPKMKKLIGILSKKRGEEFNIQVYNKIKQCRGILVKPKVSKINGKYITDSQGNTLGDIDVLYVIPNKHTIVVTEVKDFGFSKNPYEMAQEYNKMFVDVENKKCFATKHRRRVDWIAQHIDDVVAYFNLPNGKWKVKELFIFSDELLSNTYYKQECKMITYSQISERTIINLWNNK